MLTNYESFWLKDPMVLVNFKYIREFYPTIDMNSIQKLNAITRFSIISGFITFLFTKNVSAFMITAIGMLLSIFLYFSPLVERDIIDRNIKEGNPMNPSRVSNYQNNKAAKNLPRIYRKSCLGPSKSNPMMNVPITAYGTEYPYESSCKDTLETKESVEKNWNHGLFQDVSNLWGKRNSQRQFYTTPNTAVPNDQAGFANWLYRKPGVCKGGDQEYCTGFESGGP
jgi:hypothetical protein